MPYHRFGRHPLNITRYRFKKKGRRKSPNFRSKKPRDTELRVWIRKSPTQVLNPKLLEMLVKEQHQKGTGYPTNLSMKSPKL